MVFHIGLGSSPVSSPVWILTSLMTVLSLLFDVIHHPLSSHTGEHALLPSAALRAALPHALMKVGGPPQHSSPLPLGAETPDTLFIPPQHSDYCPLPAVRGPIALILRRQRDANKPGNFKTYE